MRPSAALCALAFLAPVSRVSAQAVQHQLAISPFVGYTSATGGADKGNNGPFIGAQLEFSPTKFLSLDVGVDYTFGSYEAVRRAYGGLLLRPFGRAPSGAPRPLYFEFGGGYKGSTLNGNGGNVYAGIGLDLPIMVRAAPALIARYIHEPGTSGNRWLSVGLGLRLRI